MTIWIDKEYKCHASAADGLREAESSFFDGKCVEFIDGYRFVPFGEIWTRDDGELFKGEMVTPWKPWEELEEAQRLYELEQLTNAESLLYVDDVSGLLEED